MPRPKPALEERRICRWLFSESAEKTSRWFSVGSALPAEAKAVLSCCAAQGGQSSQLGSPCVRHVDRYELDAAFLLPCCCGAEGGGGADKKRAAVLASEHARKGIACASGDGLYNSSLFDPKKTMPACIGNPNCTLGVKTEAVRVGARQLREDPPARQAAVRSNIERAEPVSVSFGHDERFPVGRERHAVWENHVFRSAMHRSIGIDSQQASRPRYLTRVEVEAEVADVGATHCIDEQVVTRTCGVRRQIRKLEQATLAKGQQAPLVHGNQHERFIQIPGKPARTAGNSDFLAQVAIGGDAKDTAVKKVGEPKPVGMPSGRFGKAKSGNERRQRRDACSSGARIDHRPMSAFSASSCVFA